MLLPVVSTPFFKDKGQNKSTPCQNVFAKMQWLIYKKQKKKREGGGVEIKAIEKGFPKKQKQYRKQKQNPKQLVPHP